MAWHVSHTTLWVRDQEEALQFFSKLGFEVREDVTNGNFRWLAVASKEQPELAIVLAKPGYPMDDATSQQVEAAVAKGQLGTLVFATDDCFAAYEELKAKGVEFTRPAGERPYGIDAAFRDPSGNEFRLLQAAKQSAGV
ncbi:MAG: VOC family protein [Candidatus Dormibacteraeota bacterium]|uniref:VOC family protein n=1 Tax=Candidatus Amunia macphersoniae TaxID=3127014 RepID=A0A934KSZ1_9BACT|nr:VOC family protein [Candidatus Dormibacteraeota bacterium]